METVLLVLGGAAGLFVGIFAGLKVGELLRGGSSARYWAVNALAMVVGMGMVFAGSYIAVGALSVAGLGFMGGTLTGLKYGYGKSVGAWRAIDTVTRSNDLPRE